MRTTWRLLASVMILLAVTATASDGQNNNRVVLRDDCDPADPAWGTVPGCLQNKGDVTNAEFGAQLTSPLSLSTVGHPSWRNDPSYLVITPEEEVLVENEGGRPHTFTRVANFGGGRIPPLNVGLAPAPECALAPGQVDPNQANPGGRIQVRGADLTPGVNRFQCCFHPWMRAAIKLTDKH